MISIYWKALLPWTGQFNTVNNKKTFAQIKMALEKQDLRENSTISERLDTNLLKTSSLKLIPSQRFFFRFSLGPIA